MAVINTYDARECVVTVGGVYITGLGEDMVTCEKDMDNVSAVMGAQGDVVVNKINNTLGTITLTVQGASPQKRYLMDLAKTGHIFDIWVINKSIDEKVGGTQAIIKKTPALVQGANPTDRRFEIKVFDYTVE